MRIFYNTFKKRSILSIKLVALLGLSVLSPGCSHTIPFKYYGLNADSYEGMLLGPSSKEDVNLAICEPDKDHATKCVVFEVEEFMKFKLDYLDMKNRLKYCEFR